MLYRTLNISRSGWYVAWVPPPLSQRQWQAPQSIVVLFPAQSYNPFQRSTLGSHNQVTGPERKLVCRPRSNPLLFRFPPKHPTYWLSCSMGGAQDLLGEPAWLPLENSVTQVFWVIHQPLLFYPIKSKLLCQDHTWTADSRAEISDKSPEIQTKANA